ncbi:hypothetical protein GCM10010207_67490 [Streptomyces atratus]|uniref:DUF3048 domain-containing protein n=1 Tax=Streptomyces atratus TaxID=1893 RepID=UPI0019C187F5|nr:hypothetical protein GCM10010207_67490 [Streptomyces atratus]
MEIDNVGPARPQSGLDKADIIHVEQVEAGLSRILATHRPHSLPSSRSRRTAESGTSFTARHGKQMTSAPGRSGSSSRRSDARGVDVIAAGYGS